MTSRLGTGMSLICFYSVVSVCSAFRNRIEIVRALEVSVCSVSLGLVCFIIRNNLRISSSFLGFQLQKPSLHMFNFLRFRLLHVQRPHMPSLHLFRSFSIHLFHGQKWSFHLLKSFKFLSVPCSSSVGCVCITYSGTVLHLFSFGWFRLLN